MALTGFMLVLLSLCGGSKSRMRDDRERTSVSRHQSQTLRSPYYPTCCQALNFVLDYGNKHGPGYIRMVFDDLDLPPRSSLQIHNGKNDSAHPFPSLPRWTRGGWTRPVIASSGKHVFLQFIPGPQTFDKYVGFRISYWTVDSPPNTWQIDRPFTECPSIYDPMDGGKLELNTLHIPYDKTDYNFDCVWLIKIPPRHRGLRAYIKITSMDLSDGGKVDIHRDIFSESRTLEVYENVVATTKHDFATLDQPAGGFTSEKGIYMRVHKPIERGHFHFIYGLYKHARSEEECKYKHHGKTYDGFKCESHDWCIPTEQVCNKLPNCPDASDEDQRLCRTFVAPVYGEGSCQKKCPSGMCVPWGDPCPFYLSYQAAKDTTPRPCSIEEKLCHDGTCLHKYSNCPGECDPNEKKCPDGTCVSRLFDACHGECRIHQKKCPSGQCVEPYERCSQDPCPWYKPYQCPDGTCYNEDRICDGYSDCMDGSDEHDCRNRPDYSKGQGTFNWKPLLALLVVPVIAIIAIVQGQRVAKRHGRTREVHLVNDCNSVQDQTDFGGTRLYPVPAASAGVAAPMRRDHSMIEVTYAPVGSTQNITQTIGNATPNHHGNEIQLHASNQNLSIAANSIQQSSSLRMLPTAPSGTESEYSRSNPPSYPSSGPPSAPTVPQSEPPSYPSSGPPSGHFPANQQQRLSVPTLSTRFPPPTYDEAMEEREDINEEGVEKKKDTDPALAQLKKLRRQGKKDQTALLAMLDEDYDYYDYTSSEDEAGSDSD